MKVVKPDFEGLVVIEPDVFSDNRGFFFESYNEKVFREAGIHRVFVQDNQSYSTKGVMRGMHFQKGPHAQAKLVRVLSGEIQDVVVDIRKDQPTFGKYYSIILSASNKKQILVPPGFAHGFLVLSETADVLYKCDRLYAPGSEGGIIFNDPAIGIEWNLPASQMILSAKDLKNLTLAQADLG